ncbi:hypothetical protein [Pseudomonas anguilliseptica]|uniref:hypothetical protein n=1 Tax=Pseudomonas anguilliseptica TaxID=53406 RepID=UPI00325B3B60
MELPTNDATVKRKTSPEGGGVYGALTIHDDRARSILARHWINEFYRQFTRLGFESTPVEASAVSGKLLVLFNRIVWIPYITAYDWLGFHRTVLKGELTLGRSVGFVHLLFGEPKMLLEKMVYVYEFGASPGGAGASNTVFFVDAKLAFGWAGVVLYCLIFTFCAAYIFSSGSRVLMVSSFVCFFIASVSSLTATLLSGGLFIYVVLAFLLFERPAASTAISQTGADK